LLPRLGSRPSALLRRGPARHHGPRPAYGVPEAQISGAGCPSRRSPIVVTATDPEEEQHMRYLLMIGADEHAIAALSPEEGNAVMAEYGAWAEEMGRRGVLQGGERLRPTTDATTVQVRDGQVLTADGPFAETKEQVGGYFVVDCKDLDEAIEIASKIPGARHGTIEVRPIWEM